MRTRNGMYVCAYVFVSVHTPACMYLSEISNLRKGTLNTNSHIFLEFVTLFLLVTCTEVSIVKPKKMEFLSSVVFIFNVY